MERVLPSILYIQRRCIYIKGRNHLKLVDKIQIRVQGGKGGNGVNSIFKTMTGKCTPDGGSGGMGGSVYVEPNWGIFTDFLRTYRFKIRKRFL